LICLVKKPVSASAQPWEAHYTHSLHLRKRFLFRFRLPVTRLKTLGFFAFRYHSPFGEARILRYFFTL
jgi:hypothetical protein